MNHYKAEFNGVKTCSKCGIPQGIEIHLAKDGTGCWTDEHDLARRYPEYWSQKTFAHKVRKSGLCDRCHAKSRESAA